MPGRSRSIDVNVAATTWRSIRRRSTIRRSRDLLAAACAADVGIELVDITSDLGMPCFSATVYEDDDAPLRRVPPSSGAGCHTDRGVAACRAISEAMQTRLTVIAGSRDDITEELHTVRRVSTAAGQFQRQLRRRPRTGSFLQAPTHETRSAADDVGLALESLVTAGMSQVVVVDLAMPDIGLPVVRVIAPGLEDTDGHGTIDRIHRLTERQQAS
ncbi:MAG: YcaO-like family protein [Acidimicrobiales bacterium]